MHAYGDVWYAGRLCIYWIIVNNKSPLDDSDLHLIGTLL